MVLNLLRLYKEKEVICTWHVLYLITDIVKVILFYIHSNDSLLSPDVLGLLGYHFALLRCLRHNFANFFSPWSMSNLGGFDFRDD